MANASLACRCENIPTLPTLGVNLTIETFREEPVWGLRVTSKDEAHAPGSEMGIRWKGDCRVTSQKERAREAY